MPTANLAIYNLGSRGVNVDKSAIHLEDGELASAQNAMPDKHGYDGALRKRNGLVKYDADEAAGSIVGFLGVPLGPGPGSGTADLNTYYVLNTGGTWYKSTNSFSTATETSALAAGKEYVKAAMLNGRLYYLSAADTVRVFDGVQDALFCDPPAAYPTLDAIAALDGKIYVGARDATPNSYLLEFDAFGRFRQVGAALASNYRFSTLAFQNHDVFAVTIKAASELKVQRIRPSVATTATAWIVDFTTTALIPTTGTGITYKGLYYVAVTPSAATAGAVYKRDNAGSYSAVDTGTNAAANVTSIAEFKSTLYAAFGLYDGTNNVIRSTTNGTTWSTAATLGTETGFGDLYVVGNKLFLINSDEATVAGYYTINGTTWTSFSLATDAVTAFGAFAASGGGSSFGATTSFVLIQGASSLQILNASGTLLTLTLPTGITLDSTRPPRFAVFEKYAVMVNTPSRPITVDADGQVRVLTPLPPAQSITLDDDGGAGALTGDYLARQTYVIRDLAGNIIAQSDYSPIQETAFTAAADTLDAEGLNLSAEDITGSLLYRTTASGTTYFPWISVDGNSQTQSVSDDQTDVSLSLVAAPTLGTCPNLSLVANWRGRLWGVDRADVDYVRYTESGVMYAWPNTNSILIGRAGSDGRGIAAFLARRDALGIGRRESLHQITGTSRSDFRSVVLSENVGVESQETVRVYKDIAYFLGKDGVYTWGAEGIKCISDGKVRSWFNTDTYFNRARFQYAFAGIDPVQNTYRLFLAAAGSSSEDRWVEYNIGDDTWWGPHKTGALTLVSAGMNADTNDRMLPLIGSTSGFLWKDQDTRTDDTATAIDFDVTTARHSGDTPDIEKLWGQPTFFGIVQAAGSLTITPSLGELNASIDTSFTFDLTKNRERLRRLGVGKHLQLRLRENTAGQDVILTGYEIPMIEVGRR